jgi:hypothetical protein
MNSIQNVLYINLEARTDRKQQVERELNSVGLKGERFNAIRLANGAIGCSLSHLKCLEIAKERAWDHVLIVEDDIQFMNPTLFVKQFNSFLNSGREYDVVLLGGNNMPPYQTIDDTCVKVSSCQTAVGYLVKGHYIDTLIQNVKTGISLLMRTPEKHVLYAIDKYWFELQRKHRWFLIIPLTVTQRAGYSDIERRQTNYTNMMTDLNKLSFFRHR